MSSHSESTDISEREKLNSTEETSLADPHPGEPVKLKKQLSLMNGVGMIVGIIIGSGIFVSPVGVLKSAGSVGLSLIIWSLCGLMSLIGALCYAELGTTIPKSGAEFAYLNEIFGALPAFLYLWVALLIIMPTGNAIIALTFAKYVLQPFFADCHAPDLSVRFLAALVILLLTFVNCYSVRWATIIQDTFAFTKVFALIIIIFAGVVYMILGHTENFEKPFEHSMYNVGDLAVAFYCGMFSFSGWNALNFVTEELKKPMRDLPRAIYISIPLVTVIYVLTNVAYFAVLTRTEILASDTVAESFGNKILGSMAWIIPMFVAMSTFGGLNGGLFSSSRLFFVGAREGHLPSAVSMISITHLTPEPSLIFLCIVTLIYLWVGHIFFLIELTSFVESLFFTMTVTALVWLRIKQPERKRPIKVFILLPVIFIVIGILLIVLPFWVRPLETGIGLAITVAGIPVYFLFVYWTSKPKAISRTSGSFTIFIQKLLLCTPQERKKTCEEQVWDFQEYLKTAKNGATGEKVE